MSGFGWFEFDILGPKIHRLISNGGFQFQVWTEFVLSIHSKTHTFLGIDFIKKVKDNCTEFGLTSQSRFNFLDEYLPFHLFFEFALTVAPPMD